MTKPSTRQRLLDAAEAHFARRGYGATSLGEIAGDVGIRTPSLYKHFEGKQALYEAVLERLLGPYFEMLYELLDAPRAASEATRNMSAVLDHYVRTPNLARLVQHAALAEGEELELLIERWYAPFFARAAELTSTTPMLQERDPADVGLMVMAFHSLLSGYVTLASLHEATLGVAPLSEAALAKQREFLGHALAALWTV